MAFSKAYGHLPGPCPSRFNAANCGLCEPPKICWRMSRKLLKRLFCSDDPQYRNPLRRMDWISDAILITEDEIKSVMAFLEARIREDVRSARNFLEMIDL